VNHIIDACTFSDCHLFLTKEGIIYKINDKNVNQHCNDIVNKRCNNIVKIQCQKKLTQITSCHGHLYGLAKNKLVCLDTDYYDSSYWVFKSVKWMTKKISYMNATLDEQHLFLQHCLKTVGYLIDKTFKKVKMNCSKRVYGRDKNTYLDFHHQQCSIIIDNQCVNVVDYVLSGVIDYHNHIYFLHQDDQYTYKDIKLVNHKPYYIDL
jgi:hypothetical protein